jgi:hypothetical protein
VLTSDGWDSAAVERLLKRKRVKLRKCYVAAESRLPDLAGEVKLSFAVDSTGHVSIVDRQDNIVRSIDNDLALCFLDVIEHVTFKPPADASATTFIITFSVGEP